MSYRLCHRTIICSKWRPDSWKGGQNSEPNDRWEHAPVESSSATDLSVRSNWAVVEINRSTWAVVGISGSTWAVAGVSWAFCLDAKTFRGSLALFLDATNEPRQSNKATWTLRCSYQGRATWAVRSDVASKISPSQWRHWRFFNVRLDAATKISPLQWKHWLFFNVPSDATTKTGQLGPSVPIHLPKSLRLKNGSARASSTSHVPSSVPNYCEKIVESPRFFFKDNWSFQMAFCGTIRMKISEAVWKEAAATLSALTSRQRPPWSHGFL